MCKSCAFSTIICAACAMDSDGTVFDIALIGCIGGSPSIIVHKSFPAIMIR